MDKIPVAVLGATGIVGQQFVKLLAFHPWFQVVALTASDKSVGKKYKEVVSLPFDSPLSELFISKAEPPLPCTLVFSALDSTVAGPVEITFATAGYHVISNCQNHRMDPLVPLLIPEVNSAHLALLENQSFEGSLITNPNCSVIGLTLALKPLEQWGVKAVYVVTLQAVSGAGYPGVPSLDILDNVIPYIKGEEEKLESEPTKILGSYSPSGIIKSSLQITAQCMRVPVTDGHMACVSVALEKEAEEEEIIEAWNQFSGEMDLPTASPPLLYLREPSFPQPKLHRLQGAGMTVTLGRLRRCSLLSWKFVLLSHNTIRGAAGGAILNAELLVKTLNLSKAPAVHRA